MRQMLSSYDPSTPVILGFRFKGNWLSGGPGYVMTKETIRRFVTTLLDEEKNKTKITCHPGIKGPDDKFLGMLQYDFNKYLSSTKFDAIQNVEWFHFHLGQCLTTLNVTLVDTRDEFGRERFLPYQIANHMFNDLLQNHSSNNVRADSKFLVGNAFYPLRKVRVLSNIIDFVTNNIFLYIIRVLIVVLNTPSHSITSKNMSL